MPFAQMGWQMSYALINGALGVWYRSYWFITMFVYYLLLGGLRLIVLRRRNLTENHQILRTDRIAGAGFLLLAVIVSGIVCLEIAEKRNPVYHTIVMIAIAVFTFFLIIKAIVGFVSAHKRNDHTQMRLQDISLVSAIGFVLSLERAMLGSFGDAEDSFTFMMETATGAVAFLVILIMGILLLRHRTDRHNLH